MHARDWTQPLFPSPDSPRLAVDAVGLEDQFAGYPIGAQHPQSPDTADILEADVPTSSVSGTDAFVSFVAPSTRGLSSLQLILGQVQH